MVPSLTAVDADGRPMTPGLLYGDVRGGGSAGSRRPTVPRRRGRRVSALDGARQAPDAAGLLARDGGGQPRAGGRGGRRLRHREHGVPVVRRHRLERGRAVRDCGVDGRPDAPGRADRASPSGRCARPTPCWRPAPSTRCASRSSPAPISDGDVLVLCGTTLIVWVTIPEFREVPGLWTLPHTSGGQVPDRRAEQRRRAVPRLGRSPCRPSDTERWIRGGCRCGRPTSAASARRSTIRIAAACSTGWTSPTTAPRCGGPPTRRRASSCASSSS